MHRADIPVLSLVDDAHRLPQALGESFRAFGFAMVRDHGIPEDLIARGWAMTRQLFALPEETKRAFAVPGIAGARGYTPFRTEIAKGAAHHDLKEFWHIGRDLPPKSPLAATMPPNLWPDDVPGFQEALSRLFAAFDSSGAKILSAIAVHLGLEAGWFTPATLEGNSVLRLLHYPPIHGDPGGAIRAQAHEDINLITLLLGAEEAGLELLSRNGEWLELTPPPGVLVVNIGDMLQRLTNHVLPSTSHRVRNPMESRAQFSRYSMPFFLHLRSDFRLETLPGCITVDNPDRYPHAITADAYLQERLREIGLAM